MEYILTSAIPGQRPVMPKDALPTGTGWKITGRYYQMKELWNLKLTMTDFLTLRWKNLKKGVSKFSSRRGTFTKAVFLQQK